MVIMTPCIECRSKIAVVTGKNQLLNTRRTGRAWCSKACFATWKSRLSSATMARTNRKHASARMIARNPMRIEATRKRVSRTLRRMGHGPRVRGGNGTGPTKAEATLYAALGPGWEISHVFTTKMGRGSGYPNHYKIDLAHAASRTAVEVDGLSHSLLSRREQDAKKQALLESRGWRVLRFTNAEVMADSARCVRMALSTTSR